ncbi:MAG: PH domain-containing protein [Candidatus Helarchaeales archaeon]
MSDRELPREITIPGDEQIQLIFKRQYRAYIVPYIFKVFASLGILFIIMSILEIALVYFTGGLINMYQILLILYVNFQIYVVLGLLGIIGVICIVPILYYFYVKSHLYIVTEKRLIVFRKFFIINIRETRLEKITDLKVKQDLWGRILNFGDIDPITPGLQAKIVQQAAQQSGGGYNLSRLTTISFKGFAGVKDPFKIAHDFKSVDKFGRVIES